MLRFGALEKEKRPKTHTENQLTTKSLLSLSWACCLPDWLTEGGGGCFEKNEVWIEKADSKKDGGKNAGIKRHCYKRCDARIFAWCCCYRSAVSRWEFSVCARLCTSKRYFFVSECVLQSTVAKTRLVVLVGWSVITPK